MSEHHANKHDDYKKGEMEISQQSASYEVFMSATKWGSLITVVILTFFIILCAVKGGTFIIALGVSVIIAALGFLALKGKAEQHD